MTPEERRGLLQSIVKESYFPNFLHDVIAVVEENRDACRKHAYSAYCWQFCKQELEIACKHITDYFEGKQTDLHTN